MGPKLAPKWRRNIREDLTLYILLPSPLSIFKLHYLRKGQLRTFFAKLAHCSFKSLGVLGFGRGWEGLGGLEDFLSSFHPLFWLYMG